MQCRALRDAQMMIGFLVFSEMRILNIAVDVGFVTGVIPRMTPRGSAYSSIPVSGESLMSPTVFS